MGERLEEEDEARVGLGEGDELAREPDLVGGGVERVLTRQGMHGVSMERHVLRHVEQMQVAQRDRDFLELFEIACTETLREARHETGKKNVAELGRVHKPATVAACVGKGPEVGPVD